jgi:hypothetical protein
MKISKTLREFIEEQVNIKAKESKNIAELKAKADEATVKFQVEHEALRDEWSKAWMAVLDKYNIKHSQTACITLPCSYHSNLPEVIAYHDAERELYSQKRLAVLNIIAEMELGGTKAELMEKLNNLQF